MDAFEAVVSEILHREGYWVQSPYRVDLTKQEKIEIGKPSSPRWELDIVAYKANLNRILIVECKSYLDSYGVRFSGFDGSNPEVARRFPTSVQYVSEPRMPARRTSATVIG